MKYLVCHTDYIITDMVSEMKIGSSIRDKIIECSKGVEYEISQETSHSYLNIATGPGSNVFSKNIDENNYYGKWFKTPTELRNEKLKELGI